MKRYIYIFSITAVSVIMNSCAVNPVTGKKEVVLMSESQEISMGQGADPQIVAQYGLYEDKALQAFISEKGQKMAAVSHRPNLKYEFKVVDSEILNAFAVPGGYVYFTRGIMAYFNNEAQFAGVLGHEIGHITARHGVAQQRNAMLSQVGLIAGMVIAPKLGQFAEQASQGLGLLMLKFGRDDERQSDKLGVEYSSKIGYDAQEMAKFFNTLERDRKRSGAGEVPDFLSSHPNPGDRYVTVGQLATEWKQKLSLTNAQINRNTYLKRIEGIVYGEDPKLGFLENSIFYHPVLKFQFPVPMNWAFQNSPQSVQMAPKGGKALMMMTIAPGKTLEESASSVLKQYNLQALETRETTVNGLRAITMIADQMPQQQQQQQQAQQQATVRTLSYIIQYGNLNYLLIGVSGIADFNNYSALFSNSMQNFRELKDASKLNKQPDRVRIKTVNQSITLEQALRQYKVADKRFEELAILNGMELKERISPGTMIKVIEK